MIYQTEACVSDGQWAGLVQTKYSSSSRGLRQGGGQRVAVLHFNPEAAASVTHQSHQISFCPSSERCFAQMFFFCAFVFGYNNTQIMPIQSKC